MAKKRREIPIFDHPLIETHCHLDYLDEQGLEETINEALAVGIERIVTIAVSAENLDTVKTLCQHPDVWGTQGIHPHEAEGFNAKVEEKIRQNLQHPKMVAVGEIGLDYYYDHADRKIQRQVFAEQLQIAAELSLPIVVHTRDADQDTQAILAEALPSMPKRGVIHSFTSGPELAQYCLDQGFFLGFNGISTFNKADNVRDIIKLTPLEQIVFETDAPYLTPVPYRGKQNAPKYLPFIAEQIAASKNLPLSEVLQQVHKNSQALFFTN